MATFLFNEIVFGPVASRRLGISLGINLLPRNTKLCNFNCLYCECGLNVRYETNEAILPTRDQIHNKLELTLQTYKTANKIIDTITFAGNGEPTLHPHFAIIIDDTILLRDKYFPNVKIAVLSNATLIGQKEIMDALLKVDYNILKLDSAIEETIKRINCPSGNFSMDNLLSQLKKFKDNLTVQTLFIQGEYNGFSFDNSSDEEVDGWLEALDQLRPQMVMVYTIHRDTPVKSLQKIPLDKLNEIAERVKKLGIPVNVSG